MSSHKSTMSSDQLFAQFFHEQPEYLDQAHYRHLPGKAEPELMVQGPALRAFCVWTKAKGYAPDPAKVDAFIAYLDILTQLEGR